MIKKLKPKNKITTPVVFYSRYGVKRTITKISENTYQVAGKTEFIRASSEVKAPNLLVYFDFEGGPDYALNQLFPDPGGSERIIQITQLPFVEPGVVLIQIVTKTEETKHG